MKGQGGGGTARGGGKSRSVGGSDTIKKSKARQTTAIDENILLLREALFQENGKDKDVTQAIAKAFLQYEHEGKKLEISFTPRLSDKEVHWAFDLTKDRMEKIYNDSGYGWDDEDKEQELTEQGARFLLVRQADSHALVGLVHFRFTVQGEVLDRMAGLPCLYVVDFQVEDESLRDGLGKHLLVLLELIGRREKMSRVSLPVYLRDEETKTWLAKTGRGYALDPSFAELGFEAALEGFEVYSKVFPSLPAKAAIPPVPAPSTTTATAPPTAPSSSSRAKTESLSQSSSTPAASTAPEEVVEQGAAGVAGSGSAAAEDEDWVIVSDEVARLQMNE
eukprot:gene2518-2758_t